MRLEAAEETLVTPGLCFEQRGERGRIYWEMEEGAVWGIARGGEFSLERLELMLLRLSYEAPEEAYEFIGKV